jgi:hypothetical protein
VPCRAVFTEATLLPNGKILVSGGHTGSGRLASVEVYNPTSGTWSVAASMITARGAHTATSLPNGQVLVTGGGIGQAYLASAELYTP